MVPFVGKVYDHGAGLVSEVLDEVPEGWKVVKGALMAPNGYVFVSNGKSRFASPSEYKSALVPQEATAILTMQPKQSPDVARGGAASAS